MNQHCRPCISDDTITLLIVDTYLVFGGRITTLHRRSNLKATVMFITILMFHRILLIGIDIKPKSLMGSTNITMLLVTIQEKKINGEKQLKKQNKYV